MKKTLAVFMALLMISALSACGGETKTPDTSAPAQPSSEVSYEEFTGENVFDAVDWAAKNFPDATVIRYANNTSTAAYQTTGGSIPAVCFYLAKELPIRTNGRYRLEVYPDGILASGVDDVIAGLVEGTFEMNCLTAGNWASYTDAFTEVNIPFLLTSYDLADGVLKAGLLDDMYARAEEDIPGVLFRGINSLGFRQLSNNARPIKTIEDVKGLKLRTMSDPIQIACWETLGASATTMSYSELYSALQQKMVDGQENPLQNLWNDKLYEVQKYCTIVNYLYSTSCQCISESFYNSMSAEDQQILDELIEEAQTVGFERIKELESGFRTNCAENGMEIIDMDGAELARFKDAMEPVYEMCIETIGQERWDTLQGYIASVQG